MARHCRLTLDYQEDLDMFRTLYSQLGNETRAYGAQEVFNILIQRLQFPLLMSI